MSTPNDKPSDLPDLPILLRLGLATWLAFIPLALAFAIACAQTSTTNVGPLKASALIALAIAVPFAGFLGSKILVARLTNAWQWRTIDMGATDGQLTFKWIPRRWADLTHRPISGFFLLYAALLAILLSAVVSTNLLPFTHALDQEIIILIYSGVTCTAVGLSVTATALFNFKSRSKVSLATKAAFRSPFGVYVWMSETFPAIFRWGHITLWPRNLVAVEFTNTVVAFSGRHPLGWSRGFTIPTRDPEQRRAIAQWAAAHNIPVTGDI
ncbi:MAG: hypothetical protein AAFX45_14840 [Pseudomonadota bacterium]